MSAITTRWLNGSETEQQGGGGALAAAKEETARALAARPRTPGRRDVDAEAEELRAYLTDTGQLDQFQTWRSARGQRSAA